MKGPMSKSHELDHDRLSEAATHADPARAPARGTRAQDLTGPTGPLPSGIVMRKQRDDNGVAADAADYVARASSSGGGRALPDHLRDKFEQSLGADLSSVRVHDGADSAASANAVGAKAYTVGNDIHFGAGHYSPTSAAGEHLLAHEVAHTVQQAGGASRGAQFKLEVSSAGDAHEVEADRAADAMVSGAPASVSGASGLARKIMREEAKGESGKSEESGPSGIGIKPSGKVTLAKVPLGSGKPLRGVDLEAEFEGSIDWVLRNGKANTDITGPGIADSNEEEEQKKLAEVTISKEKVTLEVEREGPRFWGGVTPKYGGGLELTRDGVELGGTGAIETSYGGASINLASIKVKLLDLKDKKLEPISLEAESGIKLQPYDFNSPSGLTLRLTPAGKITVRATPDYAEIAEWLAERFATDAAVDAAASAAAAAAALVATVLLFVGAAIDVSEGDDIAKISTDAFKAISDYATCYDAALRNQAAGAADKYGSQGFAQGQLDRQKLLRKYPADIVDAQADAASAKMAAKARAGFTAIAQAKFKANHKIMTKIRNGELPSDFAEILELTGNAAGVGKLGTVAQDGNQRNRVQEMEILQGATSLAIAKVAQHLGGKTIQIDPTTAVVRCAGYALEVRRLGYFDSWRANAAEFVEAQPSGALQINGHDKYLAGIDVHGDPERLDKPRAEALVCEELLHDARIVAVYRRIPMKDDADQGAQAAKEYRDDAARQNQIDHMTDGDLYAQPQPQLGDD